MPAMTYLNQEGHPVRAIQISPHEKVPDLRAFVPNLRYYPDAKLEFVNDSDEPQAVHPDQPFFHIGRGQFGYLNDWVVGMRRSATRWVVADSDFHAEYTPVPGTEEHANSRGPVAPTSDLLGGSAAMNTAELLYPEVQRIVALLTNRRNPFLAGMTIDGWKAELLTDTSALYTQGDRFIRLDNILPIDAGFDIGEAVLVGGVKEERTFVDRVIIRTPDKVDRRFTHTFSKTKSELDSIKTEFKNKGRIGPAFDGPAGFESSLERAYEDTVKDETTVSDQVEYHLDIERGPVGRYIELVRRTQDRRRPVSDNAHYEYVITVGNKVKDAVLQSSYQVVFQNKLEFLDIMRGRGAMDKAIYRHRSWTPLYSGPNAQPNAAIDNVSAGESVLAPSTQVLFQDFVVTPIDPFDPQYD